MIIKFKQLDRPADKGSWFNSTLSLVLEGDKKVVDRVARAIKKALYGGRIK